MLNNVKITFILHEVILTTCFLVKKYTKLNDVMTSIASFFEGFCIVFEPTMYNINWIKIGLRISKNDANFPPFSKSRLCAVAEKIVIGDKMDR